MRNARALRWADAIEAVLLDAERPMSAAEIAEAALWLGLVKKRSAWPEHSVQAAVSKHISDHGNEKGFEVISGGRVNTYWLKRRTQWDRPNTGAKRT